MTDYIHMGAHISGCGTYRYGLWRVWRGTHDRKNWDWTPSKDGGRSEWGEPKACVFVMLNPSTADGDKDDPTIRRCVAFAKAWRYERLDVVNLFAYRATNPKELLALDHTCDPVGPGNQHAVDMALCHAGLVICAWGAHGSHLDQDETFLGWLPPSRETFALGLTNSGHPRHPLYVKGDVPLVPFKGTRRRVTA